MLRPLVRLLAKPRVFASPNLAREAGEPILIIANHVTTYDGPLVQYALPGRMRRRVAAASSREELNQRLRGCVRGFLAQEMPAVDCGALHVRRPLAPHRERVEIARKATRAPQS